MLYISWSELTNYSKEEFHNKKNRRLGGRCAMEGSMEIISISSIVVMIWTIMGKIVLSNFG